MLLASKSGRILVAAVLLPLLYGINFLLMPELVGVTKHEERCRPVGRLKFEPEAWKQAEPTSSKRCEMVDSLLASGILLNLTANQVEQLFGKANLVSGHQNETQIIYVLGDQRVYPARSIWFPGLFPNLDRWMLEIRMRSGRVYYAKVIFT